MSEFPWRLLDTGLISAAENMALDEIILEEVSAGRSLPTLRFLRFSPPAALVGRYQSLEREIRLDFCRAKGFDVGRRPTGGGAILFQTSALGWELFGKPGQGPFTGPYDQIMSSIGGAAAQALFDFGLSASYRPRNDIEIDGRKISGTGGVSLSDGFMFQGTLLIENEIELFLKSLRVPVEKLKKREIESLKQRVCFLNDLLDNPPNMARIKEALARAFARAFDLTFVPQGLTAAEQRELDRRKSFYQSPAWISGVKGKPGPDWYWMVYQTEGGTLRVHLSIEPRQRRIEQALITGDFFCHPSRFILDMEAALKGVRANPDELRRTLVDFYDHHSGELVGISRDQVIEALNRTSERLDLVTWGVAAEEANDLFLMNLKPQDLKGLHPHWLLLPYCSKKVDCAYRSIPDCGQCGECRIGDMYLLADQMGMEPISIQSFEHLNEILTRIGPNGRGVYVGSCCEAFFSKHQREMETTGARGILINLDSTTCYDLGKGMDAYAGRFDQQTDLNCLLIENVVRKLME
ncbi:MAG: DUF116 domain-containing protein [Deltaproteobacteria bacterium]|nr:DUF116 domain-containing protein [Deltaproteobacteria bacterium]